MDYTILNRSTGETFSMEFSSKTHLVEMLAETGWECLGKTGYEWDVDEFRLINMEYREEFAGWGS